MLKKMIASICIFALMFTVECIAITNFNHNVSAMYYLAGYLTCSLIIGLYYYVEYKDYQEPSSIVGKIFKFDGRKWLFTDCITTEEDGEVITKYIYKGIDNNQDGYFYADQLQMLFGDHTFHLIGYRKEIEHG